jgi:hypothetical protein
MSGVLQRTSKSSCGNVVTMQGVDNVYTQHSPLLGSTLAALRDGSLNTQLYPFMGSTVRLQGGVGPGKLAAVIGNHDVSLYGCVG